MAPPTASTQTYRQHFIPLESNPHVFTELVHKLGVAKTLCFQDVLSIDDPDLLAYVPRPVYALVLVFPATETYEEKVEADDQGHDEYCANDDKQDVFFFKQTINNACGLYAILHAVCNGVAGDMLEPASIVARLQCKASSLTVEDCAQALESDPKLEEAYAEVAQQGDTEPPSNAEDEVDFHYICFVKSNSNGNAYLLDGDRKGPINLGSTTANQDVLSDKCLNVIRSMIAEEAGNVNFSLMALVPADS